MTPSQIKAGRRWAYGVMLAMLALSVAGNVSHTYHLDSTPSARMLAYGIFWPLIAWGAVELFVRVPWRQIVSHRLVRWGGVLLAGLVAALVSYRHLRGLLIADGEEWTVYTIGPLAVDGLMIMSTLALLLTRQVTPVADRAEEVSRLQEHLAAAQAAIDELTQERNQMRRASDTLVTDKLFTEQEARALAPTPSSWTTALIHTESAPSMSLTPYGPAAPVRAEVPPPPPPETPKPRRTRSRAASWDEPLARKMLAEGATKNEVAAAVGVDPKTIQRLKGKIAKEQAAQLGMAHGV